MNQKIGFGERLKNWWATIPILRLRGSLLEESQLTPNFLALVVSSCLIATFGLVVNSTAVIIGAMIIAPLMLPIRGLAFAILEGDLEMLRSSGFAIALGTFMAVVGSGLVGLLIGIPEFGSEVVARTQPNLIDLLVALVAGGISGYSKVKPELGDAIPGTAIAVALMPPLCVVGLTLSQGQLGLSGGAFLLYITNLLGINLACMLVYWFSGYTRSTEFTRTMSSGISLFLIGVLAIPLAFSLVELVQQAQIEAALQTMLVENSLLTDQEIDVVDTEVNWETKPPVVELAVRTSGSVTPEDVKLVETFVSQELQRPFKVVLDVTQSSRVEAAQ